MLTVEKLTRDYSTGKASLRVLDSVSFAIEAPEFVAVTGPSGSGKSTLLGLLAGLDRPSSGTVTLLGRELTTMSEEELTRYRGQHIGFVFQSFQLIPTLTSLENVCVPLELSGRPTDRARELLIEMGLADRMHHYPAQLSGGEQQRVAIARASVASPQVLFADEPTGNLDSKNGDLVMRTLLEHANTAVLLMVTHNPDIAAMAHREIRLRDGRIDDVVLHRRASRSA